MICVILQPTYLPWIGYFDLIDSSDVFVFYDDVQIVKNTSNSFDIRNRMKSKDGEVWIKVPLIKKSLKDMKFNNTVIDDTHNWREKHLRTMNLLYSRAKYYDEVYPFISELIKIKYTTIGDINIKLIIEICKKINIQVHFLKSSDIGISGNNKINKLVNICKECVCDKYLSPFGAHKYIEKDNGRKEFDIQRITLLYHNYEHPIYNQLFGEFRPFMSIIDLLFNVGFKDSLYFIRQGRKEPYNSNYFWNEKES